MPLNPGGKLLFSNDGTATDFLKYYIGNIDGTLHCVA